MAELTLQHFLGAGRDFEAAQYGIMGALQDVRRAFARSEIYPELADLIELMATLKTVLQRGKDLREALPRRIREIDVQEGEITYEPLPPGADGSAFLEDLIGWALPRIETTVEEGRTIYDFVEDNLRVEEVGILPLYTEEGYLFIPDRRSGVMHVLRYHLSIITRADERYRSLRTSYVKSLRQPGVSAPPSRVKIDLLAENREWPNPATYLIDADIDFPFEQTLLPVAKRKLMLYLCRGGTA